MEWLNNFITLQEKLPRPDWLAIKGYVDANLDNDDQNILWCGIARHWVEALIAELPIGYSITETDNFILLAKTNDRYVELFQAYLERSRKRLLNTLKNIAKDEGYGKYVVMIFDGVETYYGYTNYYGPQEGTYGLSSGMYLNFGYGHFVFPHQQLDFAEPIAVHEMTHALVSHLPIPLWLNEGMAVNMEAAIAGYAPRGLTRDIVEQHKFFWGEVEIQQFWSGRSFQRADYGQQLSYQLAQILVTNLSQNYDAFVGFANKAIWTDAGEAAAEEVFDISLGDMISNFLGDGNWWPAPDSWEAEGN